MRVTVCARPPADITGGGLAVLVFEDDLSPLEQLSAEIAGQAKARARQTDFRGKKDTSLVIPFGEHSAGTLVVAGLGKTESVTRDTWRQAAAVVARQAEKDRCVSLAILPPFCLDKALSSCVTEGVLLGSYRFDRYKSASSTEEEPPRLESVEIAQADEAGIQRGTVLAESQNYARDLVNEPGNVINPASLVAEAKRLAAETGIDCTVYEEPELREMGMNGLLGVGGGSVTPPRLIHMVYRPQGGAVAKLAFVGKGVTFDSGGLNIKPGDYMRTMKGDKTGACNVLAIMKALAKLKPGAEVHGFIGAVENMPDGGSYRPDDIITIRNGKSVEIDNTDAEGRVTLADVLSFASEQKPDVLIDMATLTGACVVALGEYTAGLFSGDDRLAENIMNVSADTGERFWRLPLDDERLRKKIRSDIADVLNTGGRYGGAITAAMFLREFVDENIPWAHLDIAGVDSTKEDYGYYRKGATGFGARTCLEFLELYLTEKD